VNTTCDLIADFVVVGGGAGGAAAAAYLHRVGASVLVLSDWPDRTAALLDSPVRLTLYNQFGRFEQRGVRNTATGGGWQQIVGGGGNNMHNGAVNQMPPLSRLDALLGDGGTAQRAAGWLARAGVTTMVVGNTPECGDAAGADLRNLSYKYERGPMECLPQTMYTYCADARAGCRPDSLHLALGGETRARARTDGIRKVTMYSDLLQPDLGSSARVLHDTRGERLELAHGRAVSVHTPGGGRVCARWGVVLAGGVFGTAEVLMRTLGWTELGGLWEQKVLPLAPVLMDPSPVLMADCADDLRTGNLHLAGRTRPQAEFTICAANATAGRPSPVLLAAWVIGMNATERGNVTLQDPATDRVSRSLAPAAPAVMEEAARAVFEELRARCRSDLVLPVFSAAFTLGLHHLARRLARGRVGRSSARPGQHLCRRHVRVRR